MKLLIILSSALIIHAGTIKDDRTEEKKCDGVFIDNEYYEKEVLKSDLDRPFLLAMDRGRNVLFFSYSLNIEDDGFKSVYLNLNTKEFGDIAVKNGFGQAVDQKTHDVYIGGDDGIYKYDHEKKEASLFGAKDTNNWSLYFKDILYYSDYINHFLYTLIDGQSIREKTLEDTQVDHFILDNEDIFFFSNSTGLYSQKKGTKDAVFYQTFPEYGLRSISMDVNGKVYICVREGIYSVEKDTVTLKKVIDLYDGFGLAFDADNNIIYSDTNNVYRLKPNKEKACT